MGCDTYLIRKQNLPCTEPRTYVWKETILWDGRGTEIADYLTDYELRRYIEPDELLGEVQELLSQEELGSGDEWIREQLTLLTEVLKKEEEDSELEYELQLSY